jgi:glycosyltransferase involved in cell wall biosynthesis/LmbE family N-acetylglucosaminyl deacetylase
MRILHTVPDSGWAGREERVLETALWQADHGHQVWIAAPLDNELHRHAPAHLTHAFAPMADAAAQLRDLVARRRIDVLDCHGEADTAAAVQARLEVPIVHSRHCLLRERDLTARQRMIWCQLDHVIVVADAIGRELVGHSLVDPARMSVVGEWVLPSFFAAPDQQCVADIRSEIGIDPRKPVVAFVGMLREEKGAEVLLRAAAHARASIPDLQVLIVGAATSAKGADLPELQQLRSFGRELGLADGLVTTGFRHDVNALLRCVDVLVVPSLREAQSRVIPQAFASRTPVIASAVGGIAELVSDGVTGWLVTPNDHVGLATRLVTCLGAPDARADVAARAHQFARLDLGQDAGMQKTIAAYEAARTVRSQAAPALSPVQAAPGIATSSPLSGLHVMLVVAHPDDETLGAGAAMAGFRRASVVHVTDGAPSREMAQKKGFPTRSAYAAARSQELRRAVALAGVETDFVTLRIRDQGAAFAMAAIAASLGKLFRQVRPDAILTHAFEGGHPDHDATAFAVHMALRGPALPIPVFEFTGYHNTGGVEVYGSFIPRNDAPAVTIRLSPEDRARKAAMLREFVSQQAMIGCFQQECESFRAAPDYDFTQRPHAGHLFYERHQFGMTWGDWLGLVRQAADALASGAACAGFWRGVLGHVRRAKQRLVRAGR